MTLRAAVPGNDGHTSAAAPKRKGGKPTSFRPEMLERVVELGAQGHSVTQIARDLRIGRTTLFEWTKSRPAFAEAMEEARDLAQAWWEDIGQRAVLGQIPKFNSAAFIVVLQSRFPQDYRDRRHHEVTASMTIAATVDRPPRETREEWLARREAELGASVVGAARPAG